MPTTWRSKFESNKGRTMDKIHKSYFDALIMMCFWGVWGSNYSLSGKWRGPCSPPAAQQKRFHSFSVAVFRHSSQKGAGQENCEGGLLHQPREAMVTWEAMVTREATEGDHSPGRALTAQQLSWVSRAGCWQKARSTALGRAGWRDRSRVLPGSPAISSRKWSGRQAAAWSKVHPRDRARGRSRDKLPTA